MPTAAERRSPNAFDGPNEPARSLAGSRLDRLAGTILWLAAALPGLVTALLLVGLVAAAAAQANSPESLTGQTAAPSGSASPPSLEAPACAGRNLVDQLRADGKLASVKAEAAKVENGDGKLWRIDKPGLAPSFLYGTMHLTDPRVVTLPEAADVAFKAAGALVIETTDVTDPKKAAAAFLSHPEYVNLPTGKTLDDLLKPADEAAVKAALADKDVPFQAVRTLQPWFSAMTLMLPACESARKAGGTVVLDVSLADRATAAGKPVEGLETAAEQLKALASLDMDNQIESLLATLKLRDRIPDVLETMTELYVAGHVAMIMPAIEAALPDAGILVGEGEGYGRFEKTIVTERNDRMATRMRPMLDRGGAFVAVGALHLPGADGLVAQLRKAGWTMTRAD